MTHRNKSLPDKNGVEKGPSINIYAFIFDTIKNFPALGLKAKENQMAEQKSWEEMIRIARDKGEIKSSMSDEEIASVFIFTSDGLSRFGMNFIVG
jgi:TetR/AcrR family transcriptional repressor of nem operon